VSPFTAGKVLKQLQLCKGQQLQQKQNEAKVHNDEVLHIINCLLLHTQQWLYYVVLEKKV